MPLDAAGREPGSAHYGEPKHDPAPSGASEGPKVGGGSKLSKKLGPLPVWGWGAVAAGVLFVLWYRARSSASSSASMSGTGATSLPSSGAGVTYPNSGGMSPLDTSLNDLVHAQEAVIQSLQGTNAQLVAQGQAPAVQPPAAPGSNPVTDLYQRLLGRAPDTGGAAFFGPELGSTPTSRQTLQAFQQVAQSPEGLAYAAAHPHDFWTGAYEEVLNREPDAAGIQYWQNLAQTTSQTNAATQFANTSKTETGVK